MGEKVRQGFVTNINAPKSKKRTPSNAPQRAFSTQNARAWYLSVLCRLQAQPADVGQVPGGPELLQPHSEPAFRQRPPEGSVGGQCMLVAIAAAHAAIALSSVPVSLACGGDDAAVPLPASLAATRSLPC